MSDPGTTIRISGDVHRRLLTIQYQLRMAGKSLSFSEIIQEMLNDQPRKKVSA